MKKIMITLDGSAGVLAETSFTTDQIEEAAALISEDAASRDIYLNEEDILKELEKKGYFKTNNNEEIEIIQFYL